MKEQGVSVQIEYVPILLGGLFRKIGSPMVRLIWDLFETNCKFWMSNEPSIITFIFFAILRELLLVNNQ